MTREKRTVRWYEDRQDRASDRVRRLEHMIRRLIDAQIDLSNLARKTKGKKARADLEARADRARKRALRLSDILRAARFESTRYGKAKTKIGIYDPVYGWKDRDPRRPRRSASKNRTPRRKSARRR